MSTDGASVSEAQKIGADARKRPDAFLIQCFAGDWIKEYYPLGIEQTKIVIGMFKTDEALGNAIIKFMDQ